MRGILRGNHESRHLNAGDCDRTFPVGGCNVFQLEYIAVGEVCEDVVRCAVADDGVKGKQGLEDDLLQGRMGR